MAFTAAVEWDVRTTGSDTNGGGFAVGSGGTDYSQQAAAQVTYTDIVIDAAVNTNCTSAANPFTSAHVGNIINVTSGTGFTVQRVQIISVATGVATCDKSLGTLGSTGGNGRLGGALATPGAAGALHVAGNTIHVKAGTYTITSASLNVAGGCVNLATGGATTRTRLIGYQATHRDGGTRPLLQASGISTFILVRGVSNTGTQAENISVDGGSLTSSQGFSTLAVAYRCRAINCTNNGFASTATAYLCEATGCSTQPAFAGSSGFGCVAYANTVTGFAPAAARCVNCASVNNSGASSVGFQAGAGSLFVGCTAYGNGSHGFDETSTTGTVVFFNCLSAGNSGWQFSNSGGATDNTYAINCAAKADGSGAFDGDISTANLVNCITLTADPFTNAAGGDFSLNGVAGGGDACKRAGLLGAFPGATINTTGYQDIGAAQHRQPGMIF